MDELDKLINEIKNMDKSERRKLGRSIENSLNASQKQQLENIMSNADVYKLISEAKSNAELMALINDPKIRQKLNDISD